MCNPLHDLGQRFDLIYSNLPNLPVAKLSGAIDHNTCYTDHGEALDPKLDAYLLGFQHLFLGSAAPALSDGGSALLMIGGRFPYDMFRRLAELSGYAYEELLCCLRLETDLSTTIDAYAAHEGEIEFDYYLYDESAARARRQGRIARRRFEGVAFALPALGARRSSRWGARQENRPHAPYDQGDAHLVRKAFIFFHR